MHAPVAPESAAASDLPAFKEFDRPDHPIDDIVPSPYQNRERLDEAKLQELAASIREIGLLQPLVLRIVKGNTYELVAGERRWRAAKIAGLKTIRVRVLPLTDIQAAKAVIIENDQREDVSGLERARGYARLMELDPSYDREKIAKDVSKSVSWVHNAMKLLELVPAAQKALLAGTITEWHAIAIARLQPADQLRALKECTLREYHNVPGGSTMSVKALKVWIAQNIHMDLDKAPFPAEDVDLVPAAGACSGCPKRAGANAALLEAGKANTCTDRSCYEAKSQGHTRRRLEALSTPGAAAVRIVQPYYLHADDKKRLGGGEGLLTQDEYKPAGKKVCPHTRAAVLLDVETGAIREETAVCTAPGKCNVHSDRYDAGERREPTKAERVETERRKAIEKKRRAAADGRRELLEGVRDAVTELREADLRLVAARFVREMHADTRKLVHGVMGWPAPPKPTTGSFPDFVKAADQHLANASVELCSRFLIVCACIGSVVPANEYYTPDVKPLEEAAGRWKVTAASIAKAKATPGPKELRLDAPTMKRFGDACCAGVMDTGRVVPIEHGGLLYAVTASTHQGGRVIECLAHRLYPRDACPSWITPKTRAKAQQTGRVLSSTGLIVTGNGREYVLGADVPVKPVETSPRTSAKKKR